MPESNQAVVDAYVQWLHSWTSSADTVRIRVVSAEGRLRAWGSPAGITPERIERWLSECTGWTRSTYYQHVKAFCTWLYLSGRIPTNPIDDLKPPRQPKSLPRPLSKAEVALVLAHAQGDERTWLLLGLFQGLRAHEIAKLRGEDIADGMLYVFGKGGEPAYLPVHAEIAALVDRYPRGYWFPGQVDGHLHPTTISGHVAKLFRAHGIKGSLHRCRHTFGTNLVREGVHVRKVQNLMRHKSLATTAIYTALDEDELRDAINMLPSSA